MQHFYVPFELKEAKAAEETPGIGRFSGLASVYGVTDLQNDVVVQGAFEETLKLKNGVVPLLWQHDPREPIGQMSLTDTPMGLMGMGEVDLDVPTGKRAYSGVSKKYVSGLSIGFDTKADELDRETRVRRITKVDLWEVSLVTFPAQPLARVTRAKAMADVLGLDLDDRATAAAEVVDTLSKELKEGRVLSARNLQRLQDAIAALQDILTAAQPEEEDGAKGNERASDEAEAMADLERLLAEMRHASMQTA